MVLKAPKVEGARLQSRAARLKFERQAMKSQILGYIA
jgi:hypothetical protein